MSDTLADIETHWCIDDLTMAHDVLDALDKAEARAYKKKS